MSESAETPIVTPSGALSTAGSDGGSGLTEGSLIGGYRVLETVDSGPEATLYRVEPVAPGEGRLRGFSGHGILVLGSIRRGRIDADRFAEAARRLAGVEHPALARPLHGGVTSDRRVWVLYGDPPGEPLDAYCDRRGLGIEQRVEWLVEVLGALTCAHSQLVLHGFLAPELVRVVDADGDPPRVVVFGFGLHALAGSGQAIDGPALLAAGMPVTALSSPEEVLGEPLSVASDVYRAGLHLLRLLFGPRPQNEPGEDSAEAAGEPQTEPQTRVRAMVERATTDPYDRYQSLGAEEQAAVAEARSSTPDALAEALRGELGRVLASTLAEEPAERPPSADAVATRLRSWLHRDRPETTGVAPSRRAGGRLVPAVLLLLVVLLGFALWRVGLAARAADRRAERAEVASSVQRTLVDVFDLGAIPEEPGDELPAALSTELERLGPRYVVEALCRLGEIASQRGEHARALAWHELARERAERAFGAESEQSADALLRGARTALAARSSEAASWSRRAFDAVAGLDGGRPGERLESEVLLASAVAESEPARALELTESALTTLDREVPSPVSVWLWRGLGIGEPPLPAGFDRDRLHLDALLARSRALVAADRVDEAGEVLERAAAAPALGDSPELAADLWSARSLLLERVDGSGEERIESLEKELEARSRMEGERAPSALEAAARLAEALAAAGRLEGAIARAARTAELAENPEVRARTWERAGRWQIDAGRPSEAIDSFERALGEAAAAGLDGSSPVELAAVAELRAGRAAAALERLDRAIGAGSIAASRTPFVQAVRARALGATGGPGAGVALREALDGLRLAGADEGPAAAPLLVALGEELAGEGEALVAEAYLRRAVTILQEAGAAEYLVAEAESALGEVLLAQGRGEEAADLLRGAAGALAGREDVPARRAQRRLEELEGSEGSGRS